MPPFFAYIILVLVSFVLIGFGVLVTLLGEKFCLLQRCYDKANMIRSSTDSSVNPCDNFYKFICGNYGKPVKKFKHVDSVRDELEQRQLWRLVRFLNKPEKDEDHVTLFAARRFYKQCLDVKRIQNEGVTPIKLTLEMSGEFPLIEEQWEQRQDEKWDIQRAEYLSAFTGFMPGLFMNMYARGVVDTPALPVFTVPPLLTNVEKPNFDKHYKYLEEIFNILKYRNATLTDGLKKEINDTVTFKIKLYELANRGRGCSKGEEVIEFSDWEDMVFSNLGQLGEAENKKSDEFGGAEQVVLTKGFREYLTSLDNLIGTTSKRVLANYVALQHILEVTPLLPANLRKLYQKYIQSEEDKSSKVTESRKLTCAQLLKKQMSGALSSLYINSTDKAKLPLAPIIKRIKKHLVTLVKHVKWMDHKNKYKSIDRINKMSFSSPLPDDVIKNITNKKEFDKFYELFCITGEDALNSYLELGGFKSYSNQKGIGKWVIFNYEYDVFSTEVYLDYNSSTVVLPVGFTKYPSYNARWPKYITFGGIGSKIAYEIIRGVDFAGLNYGADWWSNYTIDHYQKERSCLVRQLSQYTGGQFANTTIKDGDCVEDIAAFAGALKVAYLSYNEYDKERFFKEPKLPGLKRHNIDQHFFINFATFYCSQYDKSYGKNMSEIEAVEPSTEFLVDASVQNNPQFSKAFNCKDGDKMSPKKKCMLWN